MKPAIDEEFRIRAGTISDADQIAWLFSEAYQDSSHECKDASHVRKSLQSPGRSWFVAIHGSQLVGCTASQRHRWNASWEMGWTVTHPGYRSAGLGTHLVRAALDCLSRRPDFDLAFGFPRSLSMYRLVSERLMPSFVCTGHDGGLNIAGGLREYHLATVGNARSSLTHVVPRTNTIAHSDFVQQAIFSKLPFSRVAAEYPPELIVGPPGESAARLVATRIHYRFDEGSTSKPLHITAIDRITETAADVHRDLETFISWFPSAQHVRAYVLVDKEDLLWHMRSLRFDVAAYMPAWYPEHDRRYDCLLMVKRNYDGDPVAHGLADIISKFQQEFSRFYAS
jgi:GNAT superfamily N-acetyltransferase